MDTYSISQLSRRTDRTLTQDYATLFARDRFNTAAIVAHTAVIEARRIHLQAAYQSMHAYCVGEFRVSGDVAYKLIRAARKARRFSAILPALAEGRLHLSAVVMLAPYLTQATVDELVAAATHKTKAEIARLLAERFPRPDVPTCIVPLSPTAPTYVQLAPGPVGTSPNSVVARGEVAELVTGPVDSSTEHAAREVDAYVQLAPGPVAETPWPKMTPLAPKRYALQVTIRQSTHDNIRCAQELLGHQIATGDMEEMLDRAMAFYVRHLKKQKFAATKQPRTGPRRRTLSRRHIPADVKRAVYARDEGRCTFVSESGKRCDARARLEYDHVQEVARGGRATVAGIRLRCRAHNQYTAERTFGAEFMAQKREEARRTAAERTPSHGQIRERPRRRHGYRPWRAAGPLVLRGAAARAGPG